MSFTVTTFNIPHTASRREVQTALDFLAQPHGGAKPSIGAFQEGQHLVDDFKLRFPRYRIQSIFGPQPMWYDPVWWELLDMDGELVYDATKVGKEGAGPSTLTKRYVQWLDLRFLGRPHARLRLLNVHAPPSIKVPKQPGAEESRDELHEKLMEANAEKILETNTPVLLMGDFNATFNHDNLKPIRRTGVHLANRPGLPTHGDHQIDLILSRGGIPADQRRQIMWNSSGNLPKVVSGDHNGVWANFDFVKPA